MRLALLALALLGCAPKKPAAPAPTPAPPPEAVVAHRMDHPWLDVPRHRVPAGDLQLAVFDTGGPGEPVLLVHGMGSTSAFWQKQLTGERLSDHRLIAPDLPGWGDSDQPDAPYTPSFYAGALLDLLDALELDRAHVVAHSMGGQTAIVLALEHPDRVASLTLSAPAGVETFTAQEGDAIRAFWASQDLAHRSPEQARAGYQLAFARWDDDVERLLQARMDLVGTERMDGVVRATLRSVDGMLREPVRERLPELSVPVLYVHGSNDLMIPARAVHPDQSPASIAAAAQAAVPDLRLVTLEGAGHTPHHDDPEGFDAALTAFIEAH